MVQVTSSFRRPAAAAILALSLGLGACAVDRQTGERTLTGAGVGAAAGAVTGLITGDFWSKAATGAAAGAAGGFVFDQINKR